MIVLDSSIYSSKHDDSLSTSVKIITVVYAGGVSLMFMLIGQKYKNVTSGGLPNVSVVSLRHPTRVHKECSCLQYR